MHSESIGEVSFLGYGSLCTYQYKTLENLKNVCRLSGSYYQPCTKRDRFHVSLEDFNKIVKLNFCTLDRIYGRLPRVLFKAIEYVDIFISAMLDLVRTVDKKRKILIITGWALLPLILIGRLGFKKVYVWKFGIAEELLLDGSRKNRWYFYLVKSLEKMFFAFADGFIVQSPGMAAYASDLAGREKQAFMVPCVADHSLFAFNASGRENMRQELDLQNQFVVVNLGSFNPWQDADKVMRTFKAIKLLKNNAILFLVTADGSRYEPYLKKHGIEACRIQQVPHSDVPRLLWASDLALLIRIQHLVSEVASPIKYAEYLAAGLPVMVTRNVGVYSDYTVRHKLGQVVDPHADDLNDQVALLLNAMPYPDQERMRITEFARENLSDRSVRQSLRELSTGRHPDA